MMMEIGDKRGGLDILFNNAGLPQGFIRVEDSSDELFERIIAVNVRGVFNGCRAVLGPSSCRNSVTSLHLAENRAARSAYSGSSRNW